ncbi:DNA helicase-2 / ATP-dependent DNA helicase PcrA [Eubacterium pyruvativorans]|uniref:DNA 3'-5' helicase n=3 Tax=Eubacterium TaxID=1730 RepID=A0A1I7GYP0_9FIRM|nr:3'-5' exonuclease [Eubacterium pyruvativorans]MDO5567701.1 3'-5' exonuclease [Eubacteriales bacterium]MDD6706945.1 3'-5' exonuclease [Eubacterium pyruvativorans]SDE79586.1 DNA helicase-2 / ATP-dependent DNA helicase PcrA [Eubacterium pyruvativorans]SFO18479.1 DNA helicase-2 / ATP-dependent DNA helicase PcrA [Eubacterium pyruvativorans]SFU53386.1 DNA helicase-2 / ATP-dependent DNA helicase PcrA [Eubacterium pyruvativorans]
MADLLENLNEEQREAVTSTEGYVRVIAGAGSGKTRALSHRFAYLVNELGILPGHILCVTFTNKAANEMRQRIHILTGDNDTGYISTFHGFCVSVLQEDSHVCGYPKSFLVLDNQDIDQMLKMIYEERGLTLRDMTFSRARDMIEIRKTFREPMYYHDLIAMSLASLKQKYDESRAVSDIIFYGYLYQQKKCFGLDYNDLIKFTLFIFSRSEEVKLKWQKRLEYIMIDEFQDIDQLQYDLMESLCGYHQNLFIVGDPDQTIYTWRGANGKFLTEFDAHFPHVKTIMMMQNYRSTPQILHVANSLISRNVNRIEKSLLPRNAPGPKVLCTHEDTAEKEAKWIAEQIRSLESAGTALRDIAVLYRAHYVTRVLEEVFRQEKIPYVIYSGVQFFDRMEIKDALAYLRMICYRDDLSFLRVCNVPKRNLGEKRIRFLKQKAEEEECTLFSALSMYREDPIFRGTKAREFLDLVERYNGDYAGTSISELLSSLLDESGYEEALRTEGSQQRLDNLAELKQSVFEYETTCGEEASLENYLTHIALYTNQDVAETGNRVKFMTVHAAKGLEFPYVFLCAMNEGIFPSQKTNTLEAMEEERRLAFVAMTRAEQRLYLSEAAGRNFDGSPRFPSRFLLDIDPDLMEWENRPKERLVEEASHYIDSSRKQLEEDARRVILEPGQRVKHRVFGEGEILSADEKQKCYQIQFRGMDTPRSISFRVKMEIL